MFLTLLKQLRMFKSISNLVATLAQNFKDIRAFMLVLVITILF